MIEDLKADDPHIFTGAGIRPLVGYEAEAEPIIKRLERDIGFDRKETPWVMAEFVFHTSHPDAVEHIRKAVSTHAGVSDLHCPTAPDPDVPPSVDFPHPFLIGRDADPTKLTYLLSGTVNDRFLAAWKKFKKVYFEMHVWVRRPDKDEPLFLWMILANDDTLRLIVHGDKPVIVPVDTTSNYRCMYAQKRGWGV